MKFKVGDRVFSFLNGWGVVADLKEDLIVVIFEGSRFRNYYYDGRFYMSDPFPTLITEEEVLSYKIPDPPKMKVKKKATFFLNIYPNNIAVGYESRKEANFKAVTNRIACVEQEIEYEVEE